MKGKNMDFNLIVNFPFFKEKIHIKIGKKHERL